MSERLAILVVDDDAEFRVRLSRALEARGCRVVSAGDGATAHQQWAADTFDAAIVDLRLDTASGLRLIPELQQVRPAARIVVLTGFSSLGTAVEAGRLGVAEYLTKPVDVDRVFEAVAGGSRAAATASATNAPEVPSLDRVEWEHIQRVLAACDGNISQTARLLGIDRRSLQRKLAKYPPPR